MDNTFDICKVVKSMKFIPVKQTKEGDLKGGYDATPSETDVIMKKAWRKEEWQIIYGQIRNLVPKTGAYFIEIGGKILSMKNEKNNKWTIYHRMIYINGKLIRPITLGNIHSLPFEFPDTDREFVYVHARPETVGELYNKHGNYRYFYVQ